MKIGFHTFLVIFIGLYASKLMAGKEPEFFFFKSEAIHLDQVISVNSFLPIELLSFNARLSENFEVELSWTTATEKNNDRYEIEKSLDGEVWETVVILNGSGNSVLKKTYTGIDKYPYNQVCYYRLKQVDVSGRSTHAPKLKFDPENKLANQILIYPNPASNEITIQADADELADFQIFDVTGREQDIISVITYVNSNKVVLNLTTWKSGIYFLKSKSTGRKIIKI